MPLILGHVREEPVNKAQLLEKMAHGHAAMDKLLSSMDERQMLQPGVYGEMSVKDVLAHIAAWEGMEAGWIRASLNGEQVLRFAPGFVLGEGDDNAAMDGLNEQIFKQNKNKTLVQVLSDLQAAQRQLTETVEALLEGDLTDIHRFDWWDGEPIWTSIAGNSYEHYQEHIELIQDWLGSRP
jgi:hypothetical protein